ncbi:ferrous iron transport protein B [Devriesea agamarum]|uniref:ferrous iron transport protein B n=1 Tax=Devriesea agamarum TaxID=472569 RepID=UPI00071C6901|nr:ferrous iron transport protein B [Devriesea agamarum]
MAKAQTPSCHGDGALTVAPAGSAVVAFVGAPNVGKSTLFNTLTGARRSVGNWPGTSVEIGRGAWKLPCGRVVDAIDFPGAYSLDPLSPDEELTRELLIERPVEERPDLVVVVADASNLARSLYLAAQIRETSYRVVIAMTMNDVASRRQLEYDPEVLSKRLGCPVAPVDPRRRTGLDQLATLIGQTLSREPFSPRITAAASATDGPATDAPAAPSQDEDDFALADNRFSWVDEAVQAATVRAETVRATVSERVDRIILNPVLGPLIFLGVMWCVFQLTTRVASPLQDWLDTFFSGPVTSTVDGWLKALGLGNPIITGFVENGLIAGVGMVLTFVPLMIIMFLALALLEDSGYMARAAVVADRLMRMIGLPGKAFLPIIVGFGCNVPAIAATRVLPNARQRLLTALLIPFTSCSARLTVYLMVASTFFPDHAGTVVWAMYVISVALVVVVGLLLRSTLWRTMGSSPLVLDLPTYQIPVLRLIVQATWVKTYAFLKTAGGIIVATVVVVFALQAIPVRGDAPFGEVPPEDSVYATVSGAISPIFAPAGFDDWRTTGALVTGFVAKEAVVSSWAQTYAVEDPSDLDDVERRKSPLAQDVRETFEKSSHGAAIPAAWAFMVFLLAYTPCVATIAAQWREIGWRWTLIGVGLQLVVAWTLAVAIFQIGRLLW